MNKAFFAAVVVLLFLAGTVVAHYAYVRKETHIPRMLSAVTALTGIVSPALSTTFYEPRLLYMQKAENPAYPQMPPIDTTSFVYEK